MNEQNGHMMVRRIHKRIQIVLLLNKYTQYTRMYTDLKIENNIKRFFFYIAKVNMIFLNVKINEIILASAPARRTGIEF